MGIKVWSPPRESLMLEPSSEVTRHLTPSLIQSPQRIWTHGFMSTPRTTLPAKPNGTLKSPERISLNQRWTRKFTDSPPIMLTFSQLPEEITNNTLTTVKAQVLSHLKLS